MHHFRSGHTFIRMSPRITQKYLLYTKEQDILRWIRGRYSIPLLQLLVETGYGPTLEKDYFIVRYISDRYPKTLFDFAVQNSNSEAVLLLIAAGVNVNCSDGYPLRVAASRGDTKIMSILLSAGANVSARPDDGESALECAVSARQSATAGILIQAGATPCRETVMDCMGMAFEEYLRNTHLLTTHINKKSRTH